jgi:hypothetical protein
MPWTKESLEAHCKQQIEQWEREGILAKGKNELLAHFRGEHLSRQDAIKAFCYECMGGYGNGAERDCANPPCPLYPYQIYNPNRLKTGGLGNLESLSHGKAYGDKES